MDEEQQLRKGSFVGRALDQVQATKADAAHLKGAAEQLVRFSFLATDAVPIHGLQDWPLSLWERAFSQLPEESLMFASAFLSGDDRDAPPHELPRLCKVSMDGELPMSKWELLVRFQNHVTHTLAGRPVPSDNVYMDPALLWNYSFQRDFPLGLEPSLMSEPGAWRFAIASSGARTVGHRRNRVVDLCVWLLTVGLFLLFLGYVARLMVGRPELWTLAATVQDPDDPHRVSEISARTKARGTVASGLTALSFSMAVNALLDKIGQIDPSTSTVFIGMTLGGTFGFILDNQIGSDEGFREYLWSPQSGMKYALGALATARYCRYLLTILFDMFFTVILF